MKNQADKILPDGQGRTKISTQSLKNFVVGLNFLGGKFFSRQSIDMVYLSGEL